jgi:hypothetical protein
VFSFSLERWVWRVSNLEFMCLAVAISLDMKRRVLSQRSES